MPEEILSLDTLVANLRAEQVERWQAGDRVRLEALLCGRPALSSLPEVLLDLIYAEVLLREEHGEKPTLQEYVRRFPDHEASLRRQFAFHAAFGALEKGEADSSLPSGETTLDTGSARPVAAAPAAARMGPYEILEEIGRGGMGVVYKARHATLNRVAAVKVLRAGEADQELRQRFLTEARAVAALSHPNIVSIHEVFDPPGGAPFVALEYAANGSLARKIDGAPLPAREAAELLLPLAEAVQAAHRAGIIHRDLKPANVLLTDPSGGRQSEASGGHQSPEEGPPGRRAYPPSGESRPPLPVLTPKLTDFGLAKQLEDESHTRTGAILGTPSYMAPEQAEGRKDVGPLSDVYGLGAILYEMLTGRPPFKGDTALTTLAQVVNDEPVPPRRLNPGTPHDLETICLKCLNKAPARRYSSAGELADDLRRWLTGEPIRARPAGWLERAVKWTRRRPAGAALVGVSGAALAALVALWISFTLRLDEQRRDALLRRDEASVQKEIALAQREAAELQAKRARRLLALTASAVDEIAVNVRSGKMEEAASRNPGGVLFKLACFYATASSTLKAGDRDLPAADLDRLSEQYATSAVRLLRCAEQVGFFNRPRNRAALEKSKELAPLRQRADYRTFRARLP
jgi:serine/threonine protein kinase